MKESYELNDFNDELLKIEEEFQTLKVEEESRNILYEIGEENVNKSNRSLSEIIEETDNETVDKPRFTGYNLNIQISLGDLVDTLYTYNSEYKDIPLLKVDEETVNESTEY